MKDKIAVCHRTALKMFYDAGWKSMAQLKKANDLIKATKPAADGYFYADDVSKLISENKA